MKPTVYGELWWCDDECDCNHPRVVVCYPVYHDIGSHTYRYEMLWEGEYISQPTAEEYERLEKDLRDACGWYGVPNLHEEALKIFD